MNDAPEYTTRSGERAVVYVVHNAGPRPVHGAIYDESHGYWRAMSWSIDGAGIAPGVESALDLVWLSAAQGDDRARIRARLKGAVIRTQTRAIARARKDMRDMVIAGLRKEVGHVVR